MKVTISGKTYNGGNEQIHVGVKDIIQEDNRTVFNLDNGKTLEKYTQDFFDRLLCLAADKGYKHPISRFRYVGILPVENVEFC